MMSLFLLLITLANTATANSQNYFPWGQRPSGLQPQASHSHCPQGATWPVSIALPQASRLPAMCGAPEHRRLPQRRARAGLGPGS